MNSTDILKLEERDKSKCYLVNKLRLAVYQWRNSGYQGTTDTTKRLLNYWFNEDHIINNEKFEFWYAQRESIETLIYLYEVMRQKSFIDLAKEFGDGPLDKYDPKTDLYPLYGFKMATGSGKTYVMALTIIWQYFNYQFEDKNNYTSKFLMIAGEKNIIYDRLKRDYQDGKIFTSIPLIPSEWYDYFNLKVILKEDPFYVVPDSVLFLTNIQQLQEKASRKKESDKFVDNVLEIKEVNRTDIAQENRILEVLEKIPNIMILKDEAHHIYNYESRWKNILVELHKHLESTFGKGIIAELDFSATPKLENGRLFPWLIVDFTLKEAINTNIVKQPLKGIVDNASEIPSENIVDRYKVWIDVGISRWREYKNALYRLSKKPIIFFQCPSNKEADELKDYLGSIPDMKGKVLLIHTDSTGEVVKSDIKTTREYANNIDSNKNPFEVIVSTMMLNEGWDVNNVNVIVGLRSYTSERNILPEQVIGRGLRKMFPDQNADSKHSVNTLEIIGPPGLMQIIEEFEKDENIDFGKFNVDNPPNMITIYVDMDKISKDISIPILTNRIIIREIRIDEDIINKIKPLSLPLENKVLKTTYKAIDMVTNVVLIERDWNLPVPQDTKSVIAYYTNIILQQLKLPNMFSDFYPIVKSYVETKLFDLRVNLNDPRVLYKLSTPEIQKKLVDLFVDNLKDLSFTEREPNIYDYINISGTHPFPWTKNVYSSSKCILNYVPCDNDLEESFSKFLHSANDVISFCKNAQKIGFSVEYRDAYGNLRNYRPDFIAITKDTNFVLETKGEEDVNVKFKDKRMITWCEDASNITGKPWKFARINEKDFNKYHFDNLKELITALVS